MNADQKRLCVINIANMEQEKDEFFKLEGIDRKVLFWMMDNSREAIISWIAYVADDYKNRKHVQIDALRLRAEIEEETGPLR